jgi:tol-pal system protein YbgF
MELMKISRLIVGALMMGAAFLSPNLAKAEDAGTRIDLLEEQIRMLTGKVEELNFTVKQLQGQIRKGGNAQSRAAEPEAPKKRIAVIGGTEEIEAQPLAPAPAPKKQAAQAAEPDSIYAVDGAGEQTAGVQDLTKGRNAAAQADDGGFQGQVVDPAVTADADANTGNASAGDSNSNGIEQVSLQPADTPESLYKRSDEALLRRQFPEAEQGFRDFISKYPDHSLTGSAQYWLGETFYVQGDYRTAAQNFLAGYQKYPKSRRAPDSLLKLGLALNKLGQKSQACAALGNVSSEFPKAVEAKKRAQTEFKRAGC